MRILTTFFLFIVAFLITAVAAAQNTAEVAILECRGTAEEDGAPYDYFLLEKNPKSDHYTARFGQGITEPTQELTTLHENLKCEFSNEDSRYFYCTAEAGSIYSESHTRRRIPVPGFPPRDLVSAQVTVVGESFVDVLGGPVVILNFMFFNDCSASPLFRFQPEF